MRGELVVVAVESLQERGIPARLDLIAVELGWSGRLVDLQSRLDDLVWEGDLAQRVTDGRRDYFVPASRSARPPYSGVLP